MTAQSLLGGLTRGDLLSLLLVVGVVLSGPTGLAALATGPASAATVTADHSELTATGFELENRTLGPDEPLHAAVVFEKRGDGEASAPLAITVDGDRYRLGTVTAENENVSVDINDDAGESSEIDVDVEIECEIRYNDGDWYVKCTITITISWEAVSAGDDGVDVGFNDLEPRAVAIEDRPADLEATEFELDDGTLAPGESTNATVVFEKRGDGEASAPLAVTVDGERHRLGTVTVADGNGTVDLNDQAAMIDPVIRCYWADIDGDGVQEYVCVIDPFPFSTEAVDLSAGDHRVGVNHLEPATVTVEEAEESEVYVPQPCYPIPPFPEPNPPFPFPDPCLPLVDAGQAGGDGAMATAAPTNADGANVSSDGRAPGIARPTSHTDTGSVRFVAV